MGLGLRIFSANATGWPDIPATSGIRLNIDVEAANNGYFLIPTYPTDLACIGFDRSGTTRIGSYLVNHSFMVPGLIAVIASIALGYGLARVLLSNPAH